MIEKLSFTKYLKNKTYMGSLKTNPKKQVPRVFDGSAQTVRSFYNRRRNRIQKIIVAAI